METTTHRTKVKTAFGILVTVVFLGGLAFVVFAPARDSEAPGKGDAPASPPAGRASAREAQPGKRSSDEAPSPQAEPEPPTEDGTPPPAVSPPATVDPPEKSAADEAWFPPESAAWQAERDKMVDMINSYGLKDPAILEVMRAVPRHEFVPARLQSQAYRDTPLPIGHGQTISQPYIVAEMTRQLGLKKNSKVLEVGTGSGYQAAVLSHITSRVFTIEIIKPLAKAAKERLARLKYDVIHVRAADGYYGWVEESPFDAIIVTCAVGQIPPPLLKQLAPGGRMVVPVGPSYAVQSLVLVEKDKEGTVRSRNLMAVRFVPLLRKDESAE